MKARSMFTCLSLLSALTALAPAVSHAQGNDIVQNILSQILSGGQPGVENNGGCQPVNREFYDTRLDRITNHFYARINEDLNNGLMDNDEAFRYRRRVRYIYREGQNFIADGCLTPYERNRFRRDVRRLDFDLNNLEQSG